MIRDRYPFKPETPGQSLIHCDGIDQAELLKDQLCWFDWLDWLNPFRSSIVNWKPKTENPLERKPVRA